MARNFAQMRQFLEHHCPQLRQRVSGETYPIPPLASLAAEIIKYLQLFVMALVVIGDSLWSYIPFFTGPPSWYQSAKENPAAVLVTLFLILPQIVQSFVTSGAFEIVLDGEVVLFSRLETGRFPGREELFLALRKAGLDVVEE